MNIKKLKVDTDLDSLKVNRKKPILVKGEKKIFFCFLFHCLNIIFLTQLKKKYKQGLLPEGERKIQKVLKIQLNTLIL